MKTAITIFILGLSLFVNFVRADTFGTGANQFTIDFVTISGDASSANGTYTEDSKPEGFIDPGNYRIGIYEITNDQWNKFQAAYGTVRGTPSNAYDLIPFFTGTDVPSNNLSWYESLQFVNWLNTSTGHQAAYNFTGTQGTSDYTFAMWDLSQADGANLYRHKDAYYFLPTEDEWVKAAYWNGTNLQTYATKADESLHQGNGTNGTGWNYYDNGYATDPYGPWNVGSGSEELNGTYDMMGNVWEWLEGPYYSGRFWSDSNRGVRGGSYQFHEIGDLSLSDRNWAHPYGEANFLGFRVASVVPEPWTVLLLGLGGLMIRKK